MTAVTDTFGAGLGNWVMWSWSGAVGFTTSLGRAVGGNTTTSGGYWSPSQNTFSPDQYALAVIATAPSSGFVGVGVRGGGTGNSGYIGIYFSGTFYLFLENGTTNPPELASTSGSLSNGDILTLVAHGTTITLYQNGTQVLQVTDSTYTSGAPGIVFFNDTSTVSWWSGGDNLAAGGLPPGVVSQYVSTDGNGTQTWNVTSYGNGGSTPVATRVLPPPSPSASYPPAYLIMAPVEAAQATDFGDPIATAVALNAQDDYNLTLVEPGYAIIPWYADNPDSATVAQETFLVDGILPWVKATFPVTGSGKVYLIGFSKSGNAVQFLLLRHPGTFTAAAAWDAPFGMTHYDGTDPYYSGSPVGGGSEAVFGTDASFIANYALSSGNLAGWAAPFTSARRIWIGGYNTFQDDGSEYYDPALTAAGILHTYVSVSASEHNWAPTPGWVGPALAAIIPAPVTSPGFSGFSYI